MRSILQLSAIMLLFFGIQFQNLAQDRLTEYYFPGISFEEDIPSPSDFFGFEIGDWHLTHDQLLAYAHVLASASNRAELVIYGKSHEERDLFHLIITKPSRFSELDKLKASRKAYLSDNSDAVPNLPVVLYQGYSVHGDEPSGANAAMLYAYYLVAGQEELVEEALERAIVLIDPTYNPDGLTRFATWVNSNKSINTLNPDPADREHHAPWPGSRTNHYGFDLNRDWLPAQQPESKARLKVFHDWKPNILTDHHEMGYNSTYFFQPGIPSRTNPRTPPENQELTARIAEYHGAALDKIGSLYYTKESFDDFYIGKGSTYPDMNGTIGILFEQAGAEGHSIQSKNGLLTFPFAIRNQLTTSISTLKAGLNMSKDLQRYQLKFYEEARKEGKSDNHEGLLVGKTGDVSTVKAFCEMLELHDIDYGWLDHEFRNQDQVYAPGESIFIPYEQDQYRLIQAMFQTDTEFRDSLFYDVSAWTLPMAFNLMFSEVDRRRNVSYKSSRVVAKYEFAISDNTVALGYNWMDYNAPAFTYALQREGIELRMSHSEIKTSKKDLTNLERGSILLFFGVQEKSRQEVIGIIEEINAKYQIELVSIESGLTEIANLGSPRINPLRKPKVLMAAGDGVSGYDAAEIWHLMDTRMRIPIARVSPERLSGVKLSKYNVLILPHGSYGKISKSGVEKISAWIKEGGTLILNKGSISWGIANGLSSARKKIEKNSSVRNERRPYDKAGPDRGSKGTGGCIVNTELDLSHPLLYGYTEDNLPIFKRDNTAYELNSNAYSTPMIYTRNPLLSGYFHPDNYKLIAGTPAAFVDQMGNGRIIQFVDNTNFRSFWYGTNKLLMNAIFFGDQIDSRTANSVSGRSKGEK